MILERFLVENNCQKLTEDFIHARKKTYQIKGVDVDANEFFLSRLALRRGKLFKLSIPQILKL
jgi:hypothetical protein